MQHAVPNLSATRLSTGGTLAERLEQSPVLLVFLRHLGCTFCRQALYDLARARPHLERRGVVLVTVHMGAEDEFDELAAAHGLAGVPAVSDPDRHLYGQFGLPLGSLGQLVGPSAVMSGLCALAEGNGLGPIRGEPRQMPGAFYLRDGRIVRAFRHRHAGERPDFVALAAPDVARLSEPKAVQARA